MGASGENTESEETEQEGDEYDPAPQSIALRRQQRQVALGGAALSGGAVSIVVLQRFPEQILAAVVIGLLSAFLLYKLALKSTFPGDGED